MSKQEKRVQAFLSRFEDRAVAELMDQQVRQSFDGTLRIDVNRVYVDRARGQSALSRLVEKLAARQG